MNDRLIRRFVLTVAFVLGVSISVLAVLYARAEITGRRTLELEAGKAMFYVITGVLVGGVVQMIVRDFEDRRKASQAYRDLLRTDLNEGLAKLYSQVKGIRRHLRANVRDARIEAKTYSELLRDLTDNQLGLERYKRKAEYAAPSLLPHSLPLHFKPMETYVGKLATEYEIAVPSDAVSFALVVFPKLEDFIRRDRESRFHYDFVAPYHSAAEAVAEAEMWDLWKIPTKARSRER